jgi:hypothetical protein
MKNVRTFALIALVFSVSGTLLRLLRTDYHTLSDILLGIGTIALFLTLYFAFSTKSSA